MKFGETSKGRVFMFPGQDEVPVDKKAWVRLRVPSDDFIRKAFREHSKHCVELRPIEIKGKIDKGQVEFEQIDQDALYELFWDYCILEWGNIEVNDTPLVCNKENKLLLLGQDDVFSTCLKKWRDDMERESVALAEVKQKNL